MSKIHSFVSDRRGSTAMMFSLLIIPLLASVGVLLDYVGAATQRTRLQSAIDTVALRLAQNGSNWDQNRMQTEGDALLRALVAGKADIAVTGVTVSKGVSTVVVNAQAAAVQRFSFLGGPTTPVGAKSAAAGSVKKIEIALALDTTGSMSGAGKIEALRTAVANFANVMEAAAKTPDMIRIAMVPFERMVRVPTSLGASNWLRSDLLPNWVTWNGCITDRDQNYDTTDAAANAGVLSTLYPKTQCSGNLAEVMALTNDFNAIRARAASLTATGNTNVTIGIAWGHAMLNSAGPFPGALAYGNGDVDKFMVVLTDGDNTQNRWSTSENSINSRTALACAAAKAHNIKVFTIRVINGNADLLRNCATNPSMYYEVTNAAQMDPVFQQIANAIKGIRLTN